MFAESAREIAEIGRELHKRIATFAEPFAKVGRQLTSAVGAYNEAAGSFDRRVMPQLRKIEDVGAGSGRRLPALEPIEDPVRPIATARDISANATGAELAEAEAVGLADVRVLPAGDTTECP